MKDNSFITQLIIFILLLVVGLPVMLGFSIILLTGFFVLFMLLVISIGVISAPIISTSEPSVGLLINGIPRETVIFIGLGMTSLTVALFILYIAIVRGVISFFIDTFKRIFKVEVRRGKNS